MRKEQRKKFWNKWNIGIYLILFAFAISVVAFFFIYRVYDMPTSAVINASVDCLALILSALMYMSCTRTKLLDRTTVTFMSLVAFCALYNYLDIIILILNGKPEHNILLFMLSTVYHI